MSNKKDEKVRSTQGPCEPTDDQNVNAKVCKYKQWLIELWKTKNIKTWPTLVNLQRIKQESIYSQE